MRKDRQSGREQLRNAKNSGAELGRHMTDGVTEGVKQKSNDLQKGLRLVMGNAVSAAKKALGIHSPSKVFSDEVGKQIVAGVTEGISENGELARRALEELNGGMLETEKTYLREMERLDNENALLEEEKQQREYRKRLASARDAASAESIKQNEILRRKKAADAEYLAQLKASAEAEKAVLAQLEKDVKEIYGDIVSEAENNFAEVMEAQESLQEKLKDYGSMTRKVIFHGLGEDGTDLVFTELADMEGQIHALEAYAQAIEQVKERMRSGGFAEGEVQDFFSEITGMSFEQGKEFVNILLSANDEDFAGYIGQWMKKQQLAEQVSKTLFKEPFFNAVDETKQYMENRLKEAGLEIPEGFFISGSLSAENFGHAFIEEIQKQMEQIREVIDSFSVSILPSLATEATAIQDLRTYHNSTTYVLNSSGETVAEQLMSARSHSELERMRNG